MKTAFHKIVYGLTMLGILCITDSAFGWHDKTHMAISKAAGYENWYNSAGSDVTKTKAGDKEGNNHWCNNNAGKDVTPEMALKQVKLYNNCIDGEGHLYGAIIASLRNYMDDKANPGKYAEYHMAFCAHYIGDLSMPLHNVPHDNFNKGHHNKNDGIVETKEVKWEEDVEKIASKIKKNMKKIELHNEEELAQAIARLANLSRELAAKMQSEKGPDGKPGRDMTEEEAYVQLSHSASLLQAVIAYANKTK